MAYARDICRRCGYVEWANNLRQARGYCYDCRPLWLRLVALGKGVFNG